jgi:hypothetical protein
MLVVDISEDVVGNEDSKWREECKLGRDSKQHHVESKFLPLIKQAGASSLCGKWEEAVSVNGVTPSFAKSATAR